MTISYDSTCPECGLTELSGSTLRSKRSADFSCKRSESRPYGLWHLQLLPVMILYKQARLCPNNARTTHPGLEPLHCATRAAGELKSKASVGNAKGEQQGRQRTHTQRDVLGKVRSGQKGATATVEMASRLNSVCVTQGPFPISP